MAYNEGDTVKWQWADDSATGTVKKVYTRTTTRKIKGTEVKRKASKDCPAYYIEQDDGDHVLKSHSEVEKA